MRLATRPFVEGFAMEAVPRGDRLRGFRGGFGRRGGGGDLPPSGQPRPEEKAEQEEFGKTGGSNHYRFLIRHRGVAIEGGTQRGLAAGEAKPRVQYTENGTRKSPLHRRNALPSPRSEKPRTTTAFAEHGLSRGGGRRFVEKAARRRPITPDNVCSPAKHESRHRFFERDSLRQHHRVEPPPRIAGDHPPPIGIDGQSGDPHVFAGRRELPSLLARRRH